MKTIPDLRQLAAELKLSASQVSRALSGSGRVAAATRVRVRDAAHHAGYCNMSHRHRANFAVVVGSMHDCYRELSEQLSYFSFIAKTGIVFLDSPAAVLLKDLPVDACLTVDIPAATLNFIRNDCRIPTVPIRYYADGGEAVLSLDYRDYRRTVFDEFRRRNARRILTVLPAVGDRQPGVQSTADGKVLSIAPDRLQELALTPEFAECDALFAAFVWRTPWWVECCRLRNPAPLAAGFGYRQYMPRKTDCDCILAELPATEIANTAIAALLACRIRRPVARQTFAVVY